MKIRFKPTLFPEIHIIEQNHEYSFSIIKFPRGLLKKFPEFVVLEKNSVLLAENRSYCILPEKRYTIQDIYLNFSDWP